MAGHEVLKPCELPPLLPSVLRAFSIPFWKHKQPCGIGCKFDPKLSGVVQEQHVIFELMPSAV